MKRFDSRLRKFTKKCLFKGEYLFASFVFTIFFRLNQKSILTCKRTDGGGAQIHGRISVYAFAEHFGVRFLNTLIKNANFGNGKDQFTIDQNWDLQWNSLMNFQNLNESESFGAEIINTPSTTHLWKKLLIIIFKFKFRQKYIFELQSAHRYTDLNPEIIKHVRNSLREIFLPVPLKSHEKIVVHLRRGDVSQGSIRFTSDEELHRLLEGLINKYPSTSIRIYTNQTLDLPLKYRHLVQLDSQNTPFEAITHMAKCDILVMAKSSMSYFAALLNKGIVYCPNFWHPRMSDWIDSLDLELPRIS